MDHRPFEEWLLDDKPITSAQRRQMDAHLRTCTSCAALLEVNLALKVARVAAPAGGFTERFQVRLASRKQLIKRRNLWGFVFLTLSVLGLFIYISWPVLKDLIQSPVNLLASWISSLIIFWATLQAVVRAGAVLFKVVPAFLPSYIWMVILFASGMVSMAWIASLMKFTKFRQGV